MIIESNTGHTGLCLEDNIQQYLQEIHGIPRLTEDEELALARRCAAGDEDAIRQMVSSNLRLVVYIAREYAGRGVALLDLIQEGSIGLLAAAKKFDHTLDYRFSTYATKWIRHGVTRCLINNGGIIRIPHHTAEKIYKLKSIEEKLMQELGSAPTTIQIAEAAEMSPERVVALLQLYPNVCSLDSVPGDTYGIASQALLEEFDLSQPYDTLIRQELERNIQTALSALDDRQQKVLRMHFGLEDGTVYSLDDIGKALGISKERVRQIEHQAITKLQKLGTSMGLEDFLE